MSYMQMGDFRNKNTNNAAFELQRESNIYTLSAWDSGTHGNTSTAEITETVSCHLRNSKTFKETGDRTTKCNSKKRDTAQKNAAPPGNNILSSANEITDDENIYMEADTIQVDAVQVDVPKLNRKLRLRFKIRKTVLAYTFVGFVCGLSVSSVGWLTIDKLKETRILCEHSNTPEGDVSLPEVNINDSVTKATTAATTIFATQTPTTAATKNRTVMPSYTGIGTTSHDNWTLSTESPPDEVINEDNATETGQNRDKRSLAGGHVYTRWGRTTCSTGSVLIYKGFAAGGHWQHRGGTTSTVCLPEVPTWGKYNVEHNPDRSVLYRTKYQMNGTDTYDHYVPCCACQSSGRLSHMMVPGRAECFTGWTLEYIGYLMGSESDHHHAKELICVDQELERINGGNKNGSGSLLYLTEVRSGSLKLPLAQGQELVCALCTQ